MGSPPDHLSGRPDRLARRLAKLPSARVLGITVPVAESPPARLLGLACLDRARAGSGLLLPGCRSVHTFFMRFELDILFLDRGGEPVRSLIGVPPRRICSCRRAGSVLELPSPGGEIRGPAA